jgi:hypothetical protein
MNRIIRLITLRIGQDAYLVRDKLASLPVPDGYEVDARAGSDKISAHAEIKNIEAPTSIPHVEKPLVFSQRMWRAR